MRRLGASANSDSWTDGPPLPEPRSDASIVPVSGTVYVIGGFDADGKPTTTVFSLTPTRRPASFPSGKVVDTLALEEGRAGAAACRSSRWLVAARWRGSEWPDDHDAQEPRSMPRASLASGRPKPPWLYRRPDALVSVIGDFVWLYGGHDEKGPVGANQRGSLGVEAAEGFPANPDQGKLVKWDIDNAWNLPGAAR